MQIPHVISSSIADFKILFASHHHDCEFHNTHVALRNGTLKYREKEARLIIITHPRKSDLLTKTEKTCKYHGSIR